MAIPPPFALSLSKGQSPVRPEPVEGPTQTDMNNPSTAKASPEQPLRRSDIAAGKLVLRKRARSGAVLPNTDGALPSAA